MKPSTILGRILVGIALVVLNALGYISWAKLPDRWEDPLNDVRYITILAGSVDAALIIVLLIIVFLIGLDKAGKAIDKFFDGKTFLAIALVLSVVACGDSKSEPDRRIEDPREAKLYQVVLTVDGDTAVLSSPWVIRVSSQNGTNWVSTSANGFKTPYMMVCETTAVIKILDRDVLLVAPEVRDEFEKIVKQTHFLCVED